MKKTEKPKEALIEKKDKDDKFEEIPEPYIEDEKGNLESGPDLAKQIKDAKLGDKLPEN